MTDFTGLKCPVCGKEFKKDDDIVVCPICGAPYHRSCFQKTGHCIYEDKHDSGFIWKASPRNTDNVKKCPNCGHENNAQALFCEHCGASLSDKDSAKPTFDKQNKAPTPFPFSQQNNNTVPPNNMNGVPIYLDPLGGVNINEKIDDIPVNNYLKTVQANTSYYIPVFKKISTTKKSRFNFAAFLFSGAWLLYRKQYKYGLIITVAQILLQIATQFISINISSPVLNSMMSNAGIDSANTIVPSQQQMSVLMNMLNQLPWQQQLCFFLPSIIILANLIIMIFIGIKANKLYFEHCKEIIKNISSSSHSEQETNILFQEKGGINIYLAFSVLICTWIISNFSMFL